MTLFQDTGGDPRATAARLADVLAWYGAVGDAACGNPSGFALRKAALGAALAETVSADEKERPAIAFAGLLHAIGAIGNAAFKKGGDPLSERLARIEAWDVPAQGARICAAMGMLPAATPDIVRWQAECWDGTGFPDQLRWHGIPSSAQCLLLADVFLRAEDPDEALATVYLQSGRSFGPDTARAFAAWFHLNGGNAPASVLPIDALTAAPGDDLTLLDEIAGRVDAHNGVPGRWQRVHALADATAAIVGVDAAQRAALGLAARLYGAGELYCTDVEDAQFDPLARMGIDERAKNAGAAADLVADNATLGHVAEILRARAAWYDGTGKPAGMKHGEIPAGSRILAATIAFDTLHEGRSSLRSERGAPMQRIDTAIGTQFDPMVVRALLTATKAHA